MIKLPSRSLLAALSLLALTGCAAWGTHPESIAVCEGGFANDPDWSRVSRAGLKGRRLLRQFPSFEFEGRTASPLKPSTLWFRNSANRELASCSMHSCETGRCVWRIRLYSRTDVQWRIRSEYDLGPRRKITGR